jgi:uncharacterized protein (DUF1810 family)
VPDDIYQLQRFIDAQAPVIDQVRAELLRGRKQTHWMWFVFPQIKGLGESPTSQKYAIASLAEAQAYLAHAVLGPRLRECTELVLQIPQSSIGRIFRRPDDLKFHSCMTLFAYATPDNGVFKTALQKYFSGNFDYLTIERL